MRIARFWPLASAIGALALTGALAALVVFRQQNKPFGFELEWMEEILEHRPTFWTVPALVFNYLGGGVAAIADRPGAGHRGAPALAPALGRALLRGRGRSPAWPSSSR